MYYYKELSLLFLQEGEAEGYERGGGKAALRYYI